jgi:acetyltransferase-like isoleucine patch superfamily enzyme
MSRVYQKIIRAWRLLRTGLLWRWRFRALGPRSVVGRCRMVGRAKAVAIGHHSTLGDDWLLVDLDPANPGTKPKIQIGSHCSIMHGFQCNAAVGIEIQDHVLIAPRVFITDSDHLVDPNGEHTTLCEKFISAPVVIEHDCWIGVNAVILKGVRIGHHAKIGANAVVTKDVPPYSTAVGVPVKILRQDRPPGGAAR